MNHLTRREFLVFSALVGAAYWAAGCQAPIRPVSTSQPGAESSPVPLPTAPLDADTAARIDKVIGFTMDSNKVPGMAIGIVKDGKVVFSKGYGVAKLGEDRAVTPQTLFRVMDMTHLFTAAAAVQLAERGKLDLDAPIVEVLPYFQLEDVRYKQITMRHLLTQTAGLPLTLDTQPSTDWVGKTPQTDDGALERYVRSLRDITLRNDPGSGAGFGNMSADIAGDVIAKASGKVFEEHMQESILNPLGMTQSTFYPLEADPELLAAPHVIDKGEIVTSDLVTHSRERAPSVGLLTNIDDLNRFMLANLNRGALNGEQILSSSAYDELWKPTTKVNYTTDYEYIGLEWALGTKREHPVCHYWGNDVGFHAGTYLAPEQRCGVAVLGNQFTDANQTDWYVYAIENALMDLVAFN